MAPNDPRGWRLGGGVAYAALATARMGRRAAALVGADRLAARSTELELLRDAGVTVQVVDLERGPIFENVETPAGRRQTCLEPGDPVPVGALPASWAASANWLVVPIAGEIRPEWAGAIPSSAHVALGWQGLLRTLVAGESVRHRPPERTSLVERADLVGVSRHDLEPGTDVGGLLALLRPRAELLVTEGRAGGLVLERDDRGHALQRHYDALEAAEVDPTGAGDVFLAALVGAMSAAGRRSVQPEDLRWAAAAGALVVEGFGLPAVPDRASIVRRLDPA